MTAGAQPDIRPARADELDDIRALVEAQALDSSGLEQASVWVADLDGSLVGAVALERHGEGPTLAFLLRSAAVSPHHRGSGVGQALVTAALAHADEADAPVALLTETADGFFPRFGFSPTEREALPSALQASGQLQGACPATARALLRGTGPA